MPLPKRVVTPIHVARNTLPAHIDVPSELEAVTNGTLANTVRQLSSLSRHAEDLFGELAREAGGMAARALHLQARLDRLSVKIQHLDSTSEEVSIQDIQMRKAFKSSTQFDQQIFSRDTMPTAMLETYATCERPPPLDKLNPYRDDGRDGLKFYTDPGYFFELWRQEMLQDTERIQHDRGKKMRPRGAGAGADAGRRKQRVRAPPCTREKYQMNVIARGEFINQKVPSLQPNMMQQQQQLQQQQQQQQHSQQINNVYPHDPPPYIDQQMGMMMVDGRDSMPNRPNSIDLAHQYQPHMTSTPTNHNSHGDESMYGTGPLSNESIYSSGGGTPRRGQPRPAGPPPAPPAPGTPTRRSTPARDTLPPPPPPPASPPAPVPNNLNSNALPPAPPPPPPPPPPPEDTTPPPPPVANGDVRSPALIKPQPLKSAPPPPAPLPDPRDDLLKAIRGGIKLRKVEKTNGNRLEVVSSGVGGAALHDVASILARRVAVEFSESESASDSEADSDGWTDPQPPPA